MPGEPTKPNRSDVPSADNAGKAGSLPDTKASTSDDIAAFVAKARAMSPHAQGARGRLVFALDATMSRQPTWDLACSLQGEMFSEAASIGGLAIRMVYFRGLSECRATGWITDATRLRRLMSTIRCEGGQTQIERVLSDARTAVRVESGSARVRAMVFVGDAMEENPDALCAIAGELGLLKLPCFMFQEGRDADVEATYREIARLSGGAWCRFDSGSAAQLRDLLRAVAAYAAGGKEGLMALSKQSGQAAGLLAQLR